MLYKCVIGKVNGVGNALSQAFSQYFLSQIWTLQNIIALMTTIFVVRNSCTTLKVGVCTLQEQLFCHTYSHDNVFL